MLPDLSVVVPVKNEAENIAPLIGEIVAALEGIAGFEIVYVDDGSDDGTAAALDTQRAARGGLLRVVVHDRSCGQSRAVISGIQAARAPVIATLDGDGQNDPASIPAMWVRMTRDGAPDLNLVICGHRRNRKDTGWRRFASRFANRVRSWLLKDATPDSGCGLKMFGREAFLELPRFDHMHRFLPPLFIRQGREVISVDVHHRPRERGTSKYGVWDRAWAGIWDLMGVMWLQRRTRLPGRRIELENSSAKD
jgi:dolichol-phosphate mannosyltransferase